jgi:phosphoadenosine phosphosulfate reductase
MPTFEIQAFTPGRVDALNREYRGASAEAILTWAANAFPVERLAFACSFGLEDMAILEMLSRLPRVPRVFILDTGRLPQETYDVMDQAQRHYGLRVEVYCPRAESVEALVRRDGPNGFYDSLERRKACCAVRKVEPLARALRGADAWITGLRREQSPTRTGLQPFEWDEAHGGLLKIHPLLEWGYEQTREYVRSRGVPTHALHDQGYPSIGCAPCTRPVQPGEDLRAGRWWWEAPEHKECGLHVRPHATLSALESE